MPEFSRQRCLDHLPNRTEFGERLVVFSQLDSTNAKAWELVEQGVEGETLIIADEQLKSRGRGGNTWVSSPKKDLLISLIFRDFCSAEIQTKLGLATATAWWEFLKNKGIEIELKWPNDLYFMEKKLGGILVECRSSVAVVGIGLNVNSLDSLPVSAISLLEITGKNWDRECLVAEVWQHLVKRLLCLEGNWTKTLEIFQKNSYLKGCLISFISAGEKRKGFYRGISDEGALQVESSQGIEIIWQASEIRKFP